MLRALGHGLGAEHGARPARVVEEVSLHSPRGASAGSGVRDCLHAAAAHADCRGEAVREVGTDVCGRVVANRPVPGEACLVAKRGELSAGGHTVVLDVQLDRCARCSSHGHYLSEHVVGSFPDLTGDRIVRPAYLAQANGVPGLDVVERQTHCL